MASSLPPEPQEQAERLAATAHDVDIAPALPRKPVEDGPIWRLVDAIGRFAVPVGVGAAIIGFLLSLIGPEWAWASLLYLVTLVLFIIYLPALIRKNTREREATALAVRERQERARAEVARLILEQQEESSPPRPRDTEN